MSALSGARARRLAVRALSNLSSMLGEASGPLAKGKEGENSGGEGQRCTGDAAGAGAEQPHSEGPRARGHPGAPPRAQLAGGAAAVALRAARRSHEAPPSFPGTPRPRMARPGCACTQGGCGRTIERGRGNPAAAGREHPFAGALRRRGADVTAARPAAEGDGGPAGTGAPGPAGGTGAASVPAPRSPGAAEARPLFLRPRCCGVPGLPRLLLALGAGPRCRAAGWARGGLRGWRQRCAGHLRCQQRLAVPPVAARLRGRSGGERGAQHWRWEGCAGGARRPGAL